MVEKKKKKKGKEWNFGGNNAIIFTYFYLYQVPAHRSLYALAKPEKLNILNRIFLCNGCST